MQILGLDVRRSRPLDVNPGWRADFLRQIASPKTMVDVGVAGGTDALYEAFPDAHLVLVEPLPDIFKGLAKVQKSRPCTLIPKAVSHEAGEMEIIVDETLRGQSGFHRRTELVRKSTTKHKRTIQVTTLDIIADEIELETPILLKIDTEGHEINVLRGARRLLQKTDTLIIEASVAKRFEGGYSFADIIQELDGMGFRLFEILKACRTGKPGIIFLDAVFKPIHSQMV